MKRIGLAVFVLLIFQLGLSASSDVVSCERFDEMFWYVVGTVKTCFMRSATMISSEGVSISPVDSTVLGLNLSNNKKISFLSIRVDEAFPDLVAYDASGCSLKKVDCLNFRNLKKLRYLYLSGNEIERIETDTFEDLTSLEYLDLDGNKIKQINGAVFAGLTKLTDIRLKENICINKYFSDTASATTEVSKNCGFAELEAVLSRIESLSEKVFKENRELSLQVANLKAQLATSENLKQQSDVTVKNLSNEVTKMSASNAALKAALSYCRK